MPSLARTVAAIPWIAAKEFPQSPESVCEGDLGVEVPEDLWKDDDGAEVTFRREEEAPPVRAFGAGDVFREANLDVALLDPLSFPSVAYMSSSTEINLRVRGRSVELLLDVDSEEPLEGFMACGRQAEWAKVVLHKPNDWSGREAA